MPVLTGQNAIVRTAMVEIKTMAIGNKQVTLAVFRQLKDEAVIDTQTGQLKGVPWGTVNYFWGDCKEGTHLHVVWQKGMELRRCCVPPTLHEHPDGAKQFRAVQRAAERIYDAARLATAAMIGRAPRDAYSQREAWEKAQIIVVPFLVRDIPHSVNIAWMRGLIGRPFDMSAAFALGHAYQIMSHYFGPPADLGEGHPLWTTIAEIASRARMTLPADRNQWEAFFRRQAGSNWQAWETMQQHYDAVANTWQAHYTAIAALDQLFIAV